MESLAALSLACNVVQVIQFGGEAVRTISQIYREGTSVDHAGLEELTKQLLSLNLDSSVNDPELQQIARDCKNVSLELLSELSQLNTAGKSDVLRKFFRGLRKKNVIDRLKAKLADHERHLNTGLLARLRSQYAATQLAQASQFQALDSSMKRFVVNLANGVAQVESLLKAEAQLTRQKISLEHTATRALIISNQQQSMTEQQKQRLLGSLRYPFMNARRNQIVSNYPDTFEWIFRSSDQWDSFTDWLKSGEHVYFVEGKAASGKSTFMKFLVTDDRTQSHLREWSYSVTVLSHYFWLAGEPLQRNLHGFLTSLGHQMLEPVDAIPNGVSANKQHPMDWSRDELLSLFLKLIATGYYCIFLDGLDEFEEAESEDLANLLDQLTSQPNVKLCLSSRPGTFYQRLLQPCPGIRLQDLSRHDILKYVRSRFDDAQRVGQLTNNDDLGPIVSIIVEQAQGVFLWVHLALNSVLRGLRNFAPMGELLARVEQLPPDIDRLYEDMLQRQGCDRSLLQAEMALYFRLASLTDAMSAGHCSGKPLSYVYAVVSGRLNGIGETEFDKNVLLQELYRVLNRVGSLCGGFLEPDEVGERAITRLRLSKAATKEAVQTNEKVTNQDDRLESSDNSKSNGRKAGSEIDSMLMEAARSSFVFTHRSARDFLLQQPQGQSILRACDIEESRLWRLMVESVVIFRRCGGDIEHETIVERALLNLEAWHSSKGIEVPVEPMVETMIYMTNSLFGGQTYIRTPRPLSKQDWQRFTAYYQRYFIWLGPGSSKEYPEVMYVGFASRLASDLVGITLELGLPEYFEHRLQPHLKRLRNQAVLRQEYLDYLLFCVCTSIASGPMRHLQGERSKKIRKILDLLLEVGAGFERKFFLGMPYNMKFNAKTQLLWGEDVLLGAVPTGAAPGQDRCLSQGLLRCQTPLKTVHMTSGRHAFDVMDASVIMEVYNREDVESSSKQLVLQLLDRRRQFRTTDLKQYGRRVMFVTLHEDLQAWNVDQTTSDELLDLWSAWEQDIEKPPAIGVRRASQDSSTSPKTSSKQKVYDRIAELYSDKSKSINLVDWLIEHGYLLDYSDPAFGRPIPRFEDGVDPTNLPSW